MARYPMRSAWRAYQPAAEAAPATIFARMSPAGSARILGLDPGSLRTGFGIIDCESGTLHIVAQGCIATSGGPLADRLRIDSRARRGADRAALAAGNRRRARIPLQERRQRAQAGPGARRGTRRRAAALGVHEYAPRAIKLAVVGVGGAEKAQVAHMVKQLLRLEMRARGRCRRRAGGCHLPCATTRRIERLGRIGA